MLAFEVAGLDRAGAFRLMESLRLIKPVTSLGDVYSIVLHPASASHRALTPEQREAQGITEGVQGDVYSIVLHPASASHRALTPEQREAQGITEGVLR